MPSIDRNFRLTLITTVVTLLKSTANVQPQVFGSSSAEIHIENTVCPGEPTYCACWKHENPTSLDIQCTAHLMTDTYFSMFNETIIPSNLILKCDPNILYNTLSDGIFESLHAVSYLRIEVCHSMHISRQAFRGMLSLKTIIIRGGKQLIMDKECLQIPDLSNLETVTIIESGLTYAPVLCEREQLWLVNLTRNNLATFKDTGLICDHPTNIEIIDISENAITDLPKSMSKVTGKLAGFFASNNEIGKIAPTIFKKLTSVVEIDLRKNMILHFSRYFLGTNYGIKTLLLAHNTVVSLPNGIFSLIPNISFLNLNDMALNEDIWHQLNNMPMLQILFLHNNIIKSFDKEVLSKMKQLKLLDLSDNHLTLISNGLFKSQLQLGELNLTRNNITSIEKDAFTGLQNLYKLDIQQNNIQSIPSEALSELGNLVQLNISCNIIKFLPTFPASLKVLDLSENKISYIDDNVFSGLTNVLQINLAHNKINFIYQNAFKNNAKLQALGLGHNNISIFDYHMFPLNSSLNTLFLTHNNISDICAFPTEYFPLLRVLDISNNKIKKIVSDNYGHHNLFPESIAELYLARNEIYFIRNYEFQQPSLRYIDLRENRIQFLSKHVIAPSETNLMPVLYHLSGNPFFCDCNLQWLKDVITLQNNNSHASVIIQDQNAVFCKVSDHGKPYLIKDLPTSTFLCRYTEYCISTLCNCCENVTCNCRNKCPEGCKCSKTKNWKDADVVTCLDANLSSIPADISKQCTELFFSGNNLSYVSSGDLDGLSCVWILDLHSCQIREIEDGSFQWLSKLLSLDISYNLLQSLNRKMFKGLESLGRLYVAFNQIQMIEYGTFNSLKRLLYLDLTSNRLKRISVDDFKKLSTLVSLNISKNPWSCDCFYLERMKNFTIANAGQIKDIHDVSCLFYNETSNETVKYPLADVHLPELCVNQTVLYNEGTNNLDTPSVVALSTVLSLFVLGMIIFGVIFWNREFLKVWLYVKFGWKWHQKETEEDAQRPYDAFVAYSSDDKHFVIRELVPYLEENQRRRPGYRLCVHYRDFAVGASIAESIISAVKHSKRVIIILSENFLHSEWCQFEFQKAYHQLLKEKRNRIIMILLHDINNQMLDNQLGDYLKTRTYVKYGDPWFWAKVEYAMPKLDPTARQNENVIPNNHIQQLQNIIDEGDVANDDAELILDDLRNPEVDNPEQVEHEFEMEIE